MPGRYAAHKRQDRRRIFRNGLIMFLVFIGLQTAAEPWCGAQGRIPPQLLNHPKIVRPDAVLGPWQAGHASAYVIIKLKRPADAPGRLDWSQERDRQQLRRSVSRAQDGLLNRLGAGRVRVIRRFEYIHGFAAEVTLRGLEELLGLAEVESVEEDGILQLHTRQGIPLMNAVQARNDYGGAGVSIAVLDTGIDYTHPKLGGGGFPNAKVIGGHNVTAPESPPLDDNGHGTNCAGIAAGDPGDAGDYIGGVAPGARLYALKVTFSSDGSAYDSDIISALEWCITHQNDHADAPIRVASLSMGGSGYPAACDSQYPSMAEAAANIVAAGIAFFASSGNSGFCDRIAYPACISSVISVGAVFDAGLGTLGFCVGPTSCAPKETNPACPFPTKLAWSYDTPPDRETPYSNTAGFLGLFAPAHNACTTARGGGYTAGFGGTSAACPYAAGAAAVLQSAKISLDGTPLSPAAARSVLGDTGDALTDVKRDYGIRRINLGNAVASLGPPAAASVPAMDSRAFILGLLLVAALALLRFRPR